MKAAAKIVSFYWHGFRAMHTGRTLWLIIIIKVLVIFGFLKIFFYPDILYSRFGSDAERADYVLDNITAFSIKKDGNGGR